jgi:plasmid maintenance system antidote protein VapI
MAGRKIADRKPRRERRHVGCVVREELEARGWSARQLGRKADLPIADVRAMLAGGIVTRATAAGLERALGMSADEWLLLELEVREREIKQYGRPGFW